MLHFPLLCKPTFYILTWEIEIVSELLTDKISILSIVTLFHTMSLPTHPTSTCKII